MSTHSSKNDAKTPDIVTQELKKGFQWTTAHAKLTIFVSAAFVALGIGYSVYKYLADQTEEKAQEAYYKVEEEYQKLQESARPKPAAKPAKGEKAAAAEAPVVVDYEPLAQKFATVTADHPGSRAALLAYLNFSEIKAKDKKYEEIIQSADKIKVGSDLLSALVLMQKGNAQADMKDCTKALSTWEQILKMKSAQSIYPEVHLQQALCYESVQDTTHAEETYNKILAEAKDSSAAKSAEKYLRLMKTKVN